MFDIFGLDAPRNPSDAVACCCDESKGIGKKAPPLGKHYEAWSADPTQRRFVDTKLDGEAVRRPRWVGLFILAIALFAAFSWARALGWIP